MVARVDKTWYNTPNFARVGCGRKLTCREGRRFRQEQEPTGFLSGTGKSAVWVFFIQQRARRKSSRR